jgi:hypothetical protein
MDCLGSVSILFNLPSTYIQGLPSPLPFPTKRLETRQSKGFYRERGGAIG